MNRQTEILTESAPAKRFQSKKIISNPQNNVTSHTREGRGDREFMEDTNCSFASIPKKGLENFSFYAVFDGHGSAVVSEYLKKEMLNTILAADQSLFDELANNNINLIKNQKVIDRLKKAIRKGFLDIDHEMRILGALDFGSTAVVCLITPTHFFIANCGDSRALLVSDNKISLATKDHTAQDPEEKERVERAGGEIVKEKLSGKLYIKMIDDDSGLPQQPSRAFGDYFKKYQNKKPSEQIITSEPDIYVRERSEKDEFLVLASDGLWDIISNEEVKEEIQKKLYAHRNLVLINSGLVDYIITEVRIFLSY